MSSGVVTSAELIEIQFQSFKKLHDELMPRLGESVNDQEQQAQCSTDFSTQDSNVQQNLQKALHDLPEEPRSIPASICRRQGRIARSIPLGDP